MKIYYSPQCLNYAQPGHPESPVRARATYEFLEERGYSFTSPSPCSDEDILLVHSPSLLDSVKEGTFLDFDTPAHEGIYDIAKLSAGAAAEAARHCLETGETAFSLMRPPGHHATRETLGGFCYFNNIAIASIKAAEKTARVAVIDFDCHHGNGTEDIMMGRSNVLYLSLHQSPLYPGTGQSSRDNCINFPLPANTSPEQFLAALEQGLQQVRDFDPELVAISAGFDAYKLDPITNLSLELDTYRKTGEMLALLNRPTFAVLEGGYSKDLPECVYQFLSGLEERAS